MLAFKRCYLPYLNGDKYPIQKIAEQGNLEINLSLPIFLLKPDIDAEAFQTSF